MMFFPRLVQTNVSSFRSLVIFVHAHPWIRKRLVSDLRTQISYSLPGQEYNVPYILLPSPLAANLEEERSTMLT